MVGQMTEYSLRTVAINQTSCVYKRSFPGFINSIMHFICIDGFPETRIRPAGLFLYPGFGAMGMEGNFSQAGYPGAAKMLLQELSNICPVQISISNKTSS